MNIELPPEAGTGDFSVFIEMDANSASDEVVLTDIMVEATISTSLTITSPESDFEALSEAHTFEAEFMGESGEEDPVWAIRSGANEVCNGGIDLAGNTNGLPDDYDWDGELFSAEVVMSDWDNGDYCFVISLNGDDEDLQAFRHFTLENDDTDGGDPLSCHIDASRTSVRAGTQTRLMWSSDGASATLNDDNVPISGYQSVVVSEDTTFTLLAENNSSSVSCSVTITVIPGRGERPTRLPRR